MGSELTQDQALTLLWSAKGMYLRKPDGEPLLGDDKKLIVNENWLKGIFLYATLTEEATMSAPASRYGDPPVRWTAPKGTRVLVTMVSRFGDVGIRDRHLVPASDGYTGRVKPEKLCDWSREP
jgi:hypothetical protein